MDPSSKRLFIESAAQDVNAAIADLMTHLNEHRRIRRLGVTRRQLLEAVDRPSLRFLPAEPYEFSEWRTCRVGIDYHVEVAAHYYSVPHRFIRAEVDARMTVRTVEIFLKGERIAAHPEVKEIICTNTQPIADSEAGPELQVISIAPALAEAIRRIHEGESVSALFGVT